MKTLDDFNFKGKLVLVRADLNCDFLNGKIIPSDRIKESAKTISELKKKKAKVVVIAHQGTPGKRDFISLKKHSKFLNKYVKIKFVKDILGKKAEKNIENLKSGEAILLENIRFEKDEFNPGKKNELLKLVKYADFYVNDAFSVCHRNHSSITLFPKYLKSCAGRLLEKEVKALERLNIKNCLYILAGAKPDDNLKLLKKEKKILVGGVFGQLCLIASGKELGKNNEKENKNFIKNYDGTIKKIKRKLKIVKPTLPVDYAVEVNKKRKEFPIDEFPTNYVIYDIGEKTQELFEREIKKAKAIYMKGPVGFSAKKNFSKGTFRILKAISNSDAFSLIGGGTSSDAIRESEISRDKFDHISLSGGALLSYVAGEKLVGLEALG